MKSWISGLLHVGIQFVVLQSISSQHHSSRKSGPKTQSRIPKSLCLPESFPAQDIRNGSRGVYVQDRWTLVLRVSISVLQSGLNCERNCGEWFTLSGLLPVRLSEGKRGHGEAGMGMGWVRVVKSGASLQAINRL